jgi:hypothetical protein
MGLNVLNHGIHGLNLGCNVYYGELIQGESPAIPWQKADLRPVTKTLEEAFSQCNGLIIIINHCH